MSKPGILLAFALTCAALFYLNGYRDQQVATTKPVPLTPSAADLPAPAATAIPSTELPEPFTLAPTPVNPPDPQEPLPGDIPEASQPVIPAHLLYKLYIEQAEAGDAEAQYMVSLALAQCQGAIHNEEQLQRIMDSTNHPQASRDRIKQLFHDCQPLRQLLDDKHPARERKRWLDSAIESDYPIAVLQSGMMKPQQPEDQEAVRTLLARALDDAAGKDFLETQVISLIGRYLVVYEPWRHEARSAWAVVRCRQTANCDMQAMDLVFREFYHDHEYEDILQTAEHYREAFENHQWQELDLNLPAYQDY